MNIPVQRFTLALLAAIGSVFMMASAIGTLWAWTTQDASLGFEVMFPLLVVSLFALVFMLTMALLPDPSSNPTPISSLPALKAKS